MATALKRCVYTYGVPGQGMPAIYKTVASPVHLPLVHITTLMHLTTNAHRLYDLFTIADSHVRDAQLSLSEFKEHVTIDNLEEAVAPIGQLDLTRLDKGFVGDHRQISIPVLFKMLDKVNILVGASFK